MRLQRFLARAGVASRRDAEELIRSGRVRVNGEVAQLGMSVNPDGDVIQVGRSRVRFTEAVWIALNKPVGYVVSREDARGRPTVFELVPAIPGLIYVGRLDMLTSGLLLLTTEGEAANRLTHPRYSVEKAYRVRVRGMPASEIERALSSPIEIDQREVRIVEARVRRLRHETSEIDLVLLEGRHRIVRRVCDLLGLEVDRLIRTRHGPVRLGRLAVGRWRYLIQREINAVRALRAA
jgi:23S rRNA pseudouridine2605 synthase